MANVQRPTRARLCAELFAPYAHQRSIGSSGCPRTGSVIAELIILTSPSGNSRARRGRFLIFKRRVSGRSSTAKFIAESPAQPTSPFFIKPMLLTSLPRFRVFYSLFLFSYGRDRRLINGNSVQRRKGESKNYAAIAERRGRGKPGEKNEAVLESLLR